MAILEMRLQKLAGLERKKIEDEFNEVQALIKDLKELLDSAKKIKETIKKELAEIAEKYGDDRRTKIVKHGAEIISDEDLIPEVESVLVLTQDGYVKRTSAEEYRKQKRGGVGVIDLNTKEEDFVTKLISARRPTMRHALLYRHRQSLPAQNLRTSGGQARHKRQIHNELSFSRSPTKKSPRFCRCRKNTKRPLRISLMMVTKLGTAKKVNADSLPRCTPKRLIAITLETGDELISVLSSRKGDSASIVTHRRPIDKI